LNTISALLSAALLSAFAAQAETYKWDSVAMGGGGFVSGIIPAKTERGIFYARTDVGGAYRWDMRRERWIPLLDWLPESDMGFMGVESVAVDPKNAANIYLMVGTSYFNNGKSAILRSSDYGRSFNVVDITAQFKAHGNGIGRNNGERLQVDPGNSKVLYAGSRSEGLFRSTDAGASWNRLAALPVGSTPNGNGISFVLLGPASVEGAAAQRIFVGVSRLGTAGPNLYYSHDGGASFAPLKGGPAGLMPHRAVLSAEGKLYLTYANGAGPHPTELEASDRGQVWELDTTGGHWSDITPPGVPGPFSGISMDPADPAHLLVSTTNVWYLQGGGNRGDRIFASRNAGRNWVDLVARGFALDAKGIDWIKSSSIHWAGDVQFDPFDAKSAWVISGNGVFRSRNIDAPTTTWSFETAGMEETVVFAAHSLPNGRLMTAMGDYDGFMQDGPARYGARLSPAMGTTTSLAASADGRVLARVGNAIYTTDNSGASWSKAPVVNGGFGQVALSADGNVLLHSPDGSATTYRSANHGGSWTAVTGLAVPDARPVADPVNPLKFYAYDSASGSMFVSTDGGNSFAPRVSLARGGSRFFTATPGIEGDLWGCLSGAGLVHSVDSGATFGKLASVAACSAVGIGKAAPGSGYPTLYIWGTVGSVRGVLRSTDKGRSWTRVNDDAHQYGGIGTVQFLAGDMHRFGTVYMSTVGRGLAYGTPAGEEGDVPVMPVGQDPAPPQRAGQSWRNDSYPGNTVGIGMVVNGGAVRAVTCEVCK
jgi:photosystem II stability/assembly factor-like uncharacterized protein